LNIEQLTCCHLLSILLVAEEKALVHHHAYDFTDSSCLSMQLYTLAR